MGTKELFSFITSRPKWYAGLYRHNTASMLKKRFNEGTLSAKKIEEVFSKFGYKKCTEEQWEKCIKH